MSKPTTPRLPFDDPAPAEASLPDAADRAAAVDPRRNVVLEASAGTGKTRVLVDRYVNLIRAGVDPRNILAITFTRKAAAEMRERILATLARAAEEGGIDPARWRALRDRLGDVTIGTIDAFCLSLLHEFPLEADLDPGFGLADETEAARLVDEALDRTLRICRGAARQDTTIALVLASLGDFQLRAGLASLLDRRLVAGDALGRAVSRLPEHLTATTAARQLLVRTREVFDSAGGVAPFARSGPLAPTFRLLAADLERLVSGPPDDTDAFRFGRLLVDGLRHHFFTQANTPRKRLAYKKDQFRSERDRAAHQRLVESLAPPLADVINAFRRDLNGVLTRGVWRSFAVAVQEYGRTLEHHAVVDFPEALARALGLVGEMEEFTRSRFLLESRYHHLLVDEFQDTSDAQWRLVWHLVQAWREGAGLAADLPVTPSIFVVGDRKQSIYGFRDADVGVLRRAAGRIAELRGHREPVSRAIRRSFRAVAPLLAFVNALCDGIEKSPERSDAFTYEESDRFPVVASRDPDGPALGIAAAEDLAGAARAVATEIRRLLDEGTVRDRQTGVARPARAGDVAILFRSREGHQAFEEALDAEGLPSYVYKGLGFFDTDEVKDVVALLAYLSNPASDLRAAALMRSRFIRLSDHGVSVLAPALAAALVGPVDGEAALEPDDRRVIAAARRSVPGWAALADRIPPSELLDLVIEESAYEYEMAGPRMGQARENLKKVRALVRRIQNRGYLTLARASEHLDRLSAGDESNAVIDAADAVSLMTIHAAKGLEFPIVFLVNLGKGAGGGRDPIRLTGVTPEEMPVVAVGDFKSDADEDAAAREREETKRLLYVAVTRARDRLYLGTVLGRDGTFIAGRGGLGDVLPPGLRQLFSAASPAGGTSDWHAGDGSVHRFRVCPVPEARTRAPQGTGIEASPHHSTAALPHRGTAAPEDRGTAVPPRRSTAPLADPRLVGTLVHRLVDRIGSGPDARAALRAAAESVLRREERLGAGDVDEVITAAVERFEQLMARGDLAALLAEGRRYHEVPIALRAGGAILRGVIDAIVIRPDGTIAVLEFKTGVRRPEHQAQLDGYLEAVRALNPGAPSVTGQLVYPQGLAESPPDG
jgi:ATP-dependent helicase/nuclease subunit A